MTNINRLWADLIVEELVRSGIDFFFVAPGSRSTPLTTAVAAHPEARHMVHFDERGTAFAALGYGRATRRPAVWITTSGTALGNGFPAVIEAAMEGVPMLLLTADRPPELRHTGANQTIDQVKLFGVYTRWFFDLPAPTTDIDPAMVLTTVDQAVHRASRRPQGVVHLNCMFRELLAPTPDGGDYRAYMSPLASWKEEGRPYTTYVDTKRAVHPGEIEELQQMVRDVERGLLVAGQLDTPAQGEAVRRLADRLGWPLLPDVGSQIRLGKGTASDHVVGYYDLILGNEAFRKAHAPEAVLHIGGRPTSKRLVHYMAEHRPHPYVVVSDKPSRLDPNHQVTHHMESDIIAFCNTLAQTVTSHRVSPRWVAAWQDASDQAGERLHSFFAAQKNITEPQVAWLLSQHLPDSHGLVLASSMPVRDVDRFAALNGPAVLVASNRGASGIDGTVATAVGVAEGLNRPVTLLIGDLALLHDLNSLALLRERPVVVIVINNDGGGIFHFLPIAEHSAVFESFFGTPHGLRFEAAAALFGLAYHHPETPQAFLTAYRTACEKDNGTLIEVTTERKANHALHRSLQSLIDTALGDG